MQQGCERLLPLGQNANSSVPVSCWYATGEVLFIFPKSHVGERGEELVRRRGDCEGFSHMMKENNDLNGGFRDRDQRRQVG